MKKRIRFAVSALFLLCSLLWISQPIAVVEGWDGQANAPSNEFTEEVATALVFKEDSVSAQVQDWIDELSANETFADWKNAQFKLYPLGPGGHGWVAILTVENEEIGYMTVSVTPENEYQLMEYGTGPYPLFSLKTLWNSLQQSNIIDPTTSADELENATSVHLERIYAPPLLAVWQVHTPNAFYVFDAKTGEQYPSIRSVEKELVSVASVHSEGSEKDMNGIQLSDHLNVVQTDAFDPFNHIFWILEEPANATTFHETIAAAMSEAKQIVYTTNILDGQVTLPFAVIGTHIWGDDKHEEGMQSQLVMLDHYGPRLLPYPLLREVGQFHIH